MTAVWLIVGLLALTLGAEVLVRGATALARAVGLPALVIGLTVVAYGTSAPELAVSVKAGVDGQTAIALGNVVGSNTFNVLFILGLSALIVPLTTSKQLVRLDVPVVIGVSALTWALAANGVIGRVEGGVLCIGMVAYTAGLIVLGRRQSHASADDRADNASSAEAAPARPPRLSRAIVMVIVGLAMLVIGARWLVSGAVSIAQALGVSDLLIGLTVVAAGTSMPEVATSVMAGIRGQRDIAIGNVVGSNVFNLLGVLGISAVVGADGVAVPAEALRFDIPVMVAVAVACLPILFTGGRISRWEGALFLAGYAAYVTFLVLAATRHWALGQFSAAMLWFVIPLVALGIGVSVVAWRRRLRSRPPDSSMP